jgi:hypothetical protein
MPAAGQEREQGTSYNTFLHEIGGLELGQGRTFRIIVGKDFPNDWVKKTELTGYTISAQGDNNYFITRLAPKSRVKNIID